MKPSLDLTHRSLESMAKKIEVNRRETKIGRRKKRNNDN